MVGLGVPGIYLLCQHQVGKHVDFISDQHFHDIINVPKVPFENKHKPIGSMYDIFPCIWLIFMVNVGKYTIHGSYGKVQVNVNSGQIFR